MEMVPVVKFILKKAFGDAFAWGYHNNVILNGATDASFQWIQMNGYNRHLARTIAHELIHCYEAKKLGWLHSRPLAKIAMWKWEGYAEYVSYRSSIKNEKQILLAAIKKYETEKDKESFQWAMVDIDEGVSIAGQDYFRFWIMVKYLIDIKQLRFEQLIKLPTTETDVYRKWSIGIDHRFLPPEAIDFRISEFLHGISHYVPPVHGTQAHRFLYRWEYEAR